MEKSPYEPIRSWEDVFDCINRIVEGPKEHIELIKALTINLRVETGSLPGYRGSGFAEKADSIALSKQMREKLEQLMEVDLSQDELYLLVRQLVKSLPFFGASQDEIRTLRGLAEEIEYTFPCPITEDIRAEIHSKLSPRNLDLVRALLSYIRENDSEPLKKLNKYQKVFQYDPGKFRILFNLLRDLERQLANVFEPHPGQIGDRVESIHQFLRNISQIVSPPVNSQLRYLLNSIENQNRALIQTNIEILINLLHTALQNPEQREAWPLFRGLLEKLDPEPGGNPERLLPLIQGWHHDAVSLFFPGLIDSLQKLIDCLRSEDALKATLMLGEIRMLLRQQIMGPVLQSGKRAVTLEAIWLDLTLERIGYILFGEVDHVLLADMTAETLPTAIDVIRSMVLNVRAKGQGTPALEACDAELASIRQSGDLNQYAIYSVVERINAEIGRITDKTVEMYDGVTRRIFTLRQIPNAVDAANAFVDGLFRSTTLQHLSELSLKVLHFSRSRLVEMRKRLHHPSIREISYAKIIKIKRDMEAFVNRNEPSPPAYHFQPGAAEGSLEEYPILGEKGAYLAEMARLGVNVPPGFTLTSKVCDQFFTDGRSLCGKTQGLLFECLKKLEKTTGRVYGAAENPLILAVRAGSCFSMPGMMDTILNVGLNCETTEGLARLTGNPGFAWECYYELVLKYSASVFGFVPAKEDLFFRENALSFPSAEKARERVDHLLKIVAAATGKPFPQDPSEQLLGALTAIFSSWQSESAIAYRQIYNIPHRFGTAATIQRMVFGNLGQDSCSGVAFSRDPLTGEEHLFGEYMPGTQGEVLADGRGKPLPLNAREKEGLAPLSFELRFPGLYRELDSVSRKIELHFCDMQDIEFTVERQVLYILQTRPAKRTNRAALKVAIDMAKEGLISRQQAVARLDEAGLKQLFLPVFDPAAPKQLIAKGNPASPGVASGKLAFKRNEAIRRTQAGEDILLVMDRTTPNDIGCIAASRGVLTREGGMTSHAAINSRRMAKPCVTGCETLLIDRESQQVRIGSLVFGPDDTLSIDGYTGEVFLGAVDIIAPEDGEALADSPAPDMQAYLATYEAWKKG